MGEPDGPADAVRGSEGRQAAFWMILESKCVLDEIFDNYELNLAENFVRSTGSHLFLTGKAGTGKTTFLHSLKKDTTKRMIVTAPTGVAAINAGGVTLHSFFQLPFGPFIPGSEAYEKNRQRQFRFSKEKNRLLKVLIYWSLMKSVWCGRIFWMLWMQY